MNLATCIELLHSLENPSNHPVNQRSTLEQLTIVNDSRAFKGQDSKQVKCYNCNEKGHLCRNCPQPQRRQRREKCKKIGHNSNACREGKNIVAKLHISETTNTLHVPPVSKMVTMCGRQFEAFIDTGSDTSLIAETNVPNDIKRDATRKRLEGFGEAVI